MSDQSICWCCRSFGTPLSSNADHPVCEWVKKGTLTLTSDPANVALALSLKTEIKDLIPCFQVNLLSHIYYLLSTSMVSLQSGKLVASLHFSGITCSNYKVYKSGETSQKREKDKSQDFRKWQSGTCQISSNRENAACFKWEHLFQTGKKRAGQKIHLSVRDKSHKHRLQ